MTDVSLGFRPPCWCPSRWTPTWHLHTNLNKFGENVSPHIFHKKNCCDLNLGEGLCISTFFLFPDSGLNLLNGFDFLFDWSILNGVTLKTSNYVNFKLSKNVEKNPGPTQYNTDHHEVIIRPFMQNHSSTMQLTSPISSENLMQSILGELGLRCWRCRWLFL